MLGILIQIVTLGALMYVVARHEADISWAKLFMVFVPLIIAVHLMWVVIGISSLLLYLIGVILGLKLWFYVDWGKATIIAAAQVIITVLVSMGIVALKS